MLNPLRTASHAGLPCLRPADPIATRGAGVLEEVPAADQGAANEDATDQGATPDAAISDGNLSRDRNVAAGPISVGGRSADDRSVGDRARSGFHAARQSFFKATNSPVAASHSPDALAEAVDRRPRDGAAASDSAAIGAASAGRSATVVRPAPTSRRNRQHIYVDKMAWLELRALAARRQVSMTSCVNAAIRDWTAREWDQVEAEEPVLDLVQMLSGSAR